MTQWFFPSWNGDVRIESDSKNADKTVITMIDPTADEKRVLVSLADLFREKGWMNGRKTIWIPRGKKDKQSITLNTSMLNIGLYMIGYLKPGIATLTAVKLKDGKVKAKASGEKGFITWLNNLFGKGQEIGAVADFADILEQKEKDGFPEPDKPAKVEKAATVKRPTPSCPACIPGSIEPANEVLQGFLDEEQHEQWAKDRSIIVTGFDVLDIPDQNRRDSTPLAHEDPREGPLAGQRRDSALVPGSAISLSKRGSGPFQGSQEPLPTEGLE